MSGALTGSDNRSAAIRRVFLGLLAANLVVVGAKAVIGLKAGSLAVLGDAVHSSVDAINNIVFMVLMRVAGRGPDEDHPYGHTKFEVLGAIGIVIFLSVASFELLKGAIHGLLNAAAPPTFSDTSLALIVGTLLVNIWVAWYEARKGREYHSDLLLADAAHTKADVFITLGVLAGATLSRRGVPYVDPAVAIIVTVLIGRMGWEIVQRALPTLVDQVARAPESIRQSAQGIAGVESAYAIRSRSAAGVIFAELTIGVHGALPVDRAHVIADAVEQQLKRDLRLDEVVVHVEPC